MSLALRRLDAADPGFDAALAALRHWSDDADAAIEAAVAAIVADVRRRGDAALIEHTARLDRLPVASAAELEIPAAELQSALEAVTPAQRAALQAAALRVRHYHERQLAAIGQGWSYRDAEGSLLGQKVTPLDRVGIYVPGGKAAYPSSVLMNALPARVAGVGEIVMVVPTPGGERNPLLLAAAAVCGVDRVFTIGGAQAVAALAWGTATIPRVDKITGPGNAYVAAAKRRVFGQVGIDMIAGPSEILVIADGTTPADWVAMDLFSQAEHDELAQSLLLCPDAAYLDAVQAAIERLLPGQPRASVIRASLESRGALVRTASMQQACEIANRIAPEHLELSTREPQRWEPLLRHAGAIFLGAWTSESLGDYCAGPNHVLPTAGTARFSSPLGVTDFHKRSSLIEVSAAGARVLGGIAAELAHGEGLTAHARAAELRLQPAEGMPAASATPGDATAAAAAIDLQPASPANLDALLRLAVDPAQRGFVASNDRSLAQAAFTPGGRPLAICAGGQPVGLMLLYDARHDRERERHALWIWRLMIDAAHQRRGHGAAAVRWAIDEARRLGFPTIGLSHVAQNTAAAALYQRLGFRYTGEVDEGELVMELALR